MKKKVKVSICPKCRTVDVGYVFKIKNLFGLIPKMTCKKCGYSNVTFPVAVIEEDKLKNLLKN